MSTHHSIFGDSDVDMTRDFDKIRKISSPLLFPSLPLISCVSLEPSGSPKPQVNSITNIGYIFVYNHWCVVLSSDG